MENRPTVWYANIEESLVDQIYKTGKSLWNIRQEVEMDKDAMHEIEDIRDILNNRYKSGFTYDMILKKWLEIRLLFDIKYTMNNNSMENLPSHYRRDGSLKDDRSESWKLFRQLEFLVDHDWKKPSNY